MQETCEDIKGSAACRYLMTMKKPKEFLVIFYENATNVIEFCHFFSFSFSVSFILIAEFRVSIYFQFSL